MLPEITYCEQALMGNYFQPLNTISNIFFILAAIFLYFFFKKNKIKDVKSKIFLVLVLFIGMVSFVYHFYDTQITFLFDVLAIGIFFTVYIYFLIFHISENKKISIYVTLLFIIIVGLGGLIIRLTSNFLNGAEGYVLSLVFLAGIIIYAYSKKLKIAKKLTIVFLLFLAALIFRHVDVLVCEYLQIGTHFLWHLATSVILYYSVRILYK